MRSNKTKGTIYVLPNHHLVDKAIYRNCAWGPARKVQTELSGRASWIHAFPLIFEYSDQLYYTDGSKYDPPEIDEVFPDAQNRWMSDFLKTDKTGKAPATYSHRFERLRIIDLYCRLRENNPWPFSSQMELPF
ncbi:MAG: hypothetical protein ABJK17_00460 [Ascidiaceihabitans sp.]|uniref:hypothetical protein n=1 Tax=Ascidiaceihabitans sp. TaxID=1872644 RepID=UPI003296CC8D